MHIDTSSITDRFSQLRPSTTARPQTFDPTTANNTEASKSLTDVAESATVKRRGQLAPQSKGSSIQLRKDAAQVPKALSDFAAQKSIVPVAPDQPDNPVDSLLADWGRADSNYDMNNDGTVNTEDLLLLLTKLSAQDTPAVDTPDHPIIQSEPIPTPAIPEPSTTLTPKPVANLITPDSTPQKPDNSVEALLADWGKADSQYDLNKDGTVSTKDLLMLLDRIAQESSQIVDKDGTIVPDVSSGDGPLPPDVYGGRISDESPISPMQQLLNDWGKADSAFDFNGDGTVGTADLLMLLSKIGQSDESSGSEVPKAGQSLTSVQNNLRISDFSTNEDVRPKLQNVLMERLTQFSPANFNKFISETMQLITGQGKQTTQPSRSEPHTSVSRAYQRVNTDQTASQLAQRLANTGESELRRFLNNADFSATEKRSILGQLHNLNLGTLGVNVVG